MIRWKDWCPNNCGKQVIFMRGNITVRTQSKSRDIMKKLYYCHKCDSLFRLTNWHKKLSRNDRIYEKLKGVTLVEQRHY